MPYSKSQVDRAGRALADFLRTSPDKPFPSSLFGDIQVVDWWRSIHAAALSSTNMGIRSAMRTAGVDGAQPIQRLKRLPQIVHKLTRSSGRLTQMEDIAGCRVVLADSRSVEQLRRQLLNAYKMSVTHVDDYVASPRSGGYRAVHIHAKRETLRVEIQIRTPRQQEWASVVEDIDEDLGTDIKHENGPDPLINFMSALSDVYYQEESGVPVDTSPVHAASQELQVWLAERLKG